MSFLDALNNFINGNNPDVIIFEVVNQLLDNFKFFVKKKNPNVPDTRFELLVDLTYEKLFKEGFKSVLVNSKDDEDAKERIRYLIAQYYDSQYLSANPKIQQLNDDVKEILSQYASVFPQVGKAKFTHHKVITLADDFQIESFENHSFSKNEPKKSRLNKVFFTIYHILRNQNDNSIFYSDLINELKSKLNIVENEEIPFFQEEKDEHKDPDINVVIAEVDDDPDSDFSPFINDDRSERPEQNFSPSGLENFEFKDSNILVVALNKFVNLCTERQRFIFGLYLLKENAALNESSASETEEINKYKELKDSLSNKFKELKNYFEISPATLYNEKDSAIEKLKTIFAIYKLDESQKRNLISNLIDNFEDYLINNGF